MQNASCILKILFNNDKLTPRAKKIKTFHTIETKWGIRNCCQDRTLCSHIEKVRESMFKIHVECLNQYSNTLRLFYNHGAKYFRKTLVFIGNSALLEKFNFYFQGVFC